MTVGREEPIWCGVHSIVIDIPPWLIRATLVTLALYGVVGVLWLAGRRR